MRGTPPAEIEIDEKLVRELLEEQHADLASLPLQLADSGWDNVMFRLGDDLAVRLPRRQLGAELAKHEHACLPTFAGKLPLPIPAPLRLGETNERYPWRWSIVPWLEGQTAALVPPASSCLLYTSPSPRDR